MSGSAQKGTRRAAVVIKEEGPREAADMSAEVFILVGLVGRVMTETNNWSRLVALRRVIDQLTQVEMSVYLLHNWLDERTPRRSGPNPKRQGSASGGAEVRVIRHV